MSDQLHQQLLLLSEALVRVESAMPPTHEIRELANRIETEILHSDVEPDAPMRLGDAIRLVESEDPDVMVFWGLGVPHAYRGDYDCLALEPGRLTTAKQLAEVLHGTLIRRRFCGYKGGELCVDESTRVYVAERGSCGVPLSENLLKTMLGRTTC